MAGWPALIQINLGIAALTANRRNEILPVFRPQRPDLDLASVSERINL